MKEDPKKNLKHAYIYVWPTISIVIMLYISFFKEDFKNCRASTPMHFIPRKQNVASRRRNSHVLIFVFLGVIHKPCGKFRGRGVCQMTILYHKPYLVKVTNKVGGGQKFDNVIYG